MRHPANTAPYHARHSFHIPHHAALQHAIAPALHHGGNGAYLDTSQHSCTRHPCIYIACTFPMARRAASDLIPTCRASCSPHCSALRSACCSAFCAGCCSAVNARSPLGRAHLLSQRRRRVQHRHRAPRRLLRAARRQIRRTTLGLLRYRSSPPPAPRIVHGITPAGSRVLPRDLGAVRAGGCTCRVVVHDTRSLVLPNQGAAPFYGSNHSHARVPPFKACMLHV